MPEQDLPFTHREVSAPMTGSAVVEGVVRGSSAAGRAMLLHGLFWVVGVLALMGLYWAAVAVGGEAGGRTVLILAVVVGWIWTIGVALRALVRWFRRGRDPRP